MLKKTAVSIEDAGSYLADENRAGWSLREKCQICNALQGCKHNVRESRRERERERQDIPEKSLGEWGYQGRTSSGELYSNLHLLGLSAKT